MGKQRSKNKSIKSSGGNYSKMIVSFIIVANIVFTGIVFFAFLVTSQEPSTLITAWFAFTTVELWNLARIKSKKEETKQKEIRYGDDCNIKEDFNNYG